MHHSSMKVDLSNFFKDERRQSLVFIDATWQNIKDVQDHIQNLFSLKDISLLTTDGCFLSPRESIKVLKAADGLKAFRFANSDQDTFVCPAPVKSSKKRKNRSAEEGVHLDASTPLRPSKRSKNQGDNKWIENSAEISLVKAEEKEQDTPGPSVESKRSKNKGQNKKTPETQTILNATEEDEAANKKKRSKNKNRHKASDVPAEILQEEETPAPASTSSSTHMETKMSKNKNHAKSHKFETDKPTEMELEEGEVEEPAGPTREPSKERTLSGSPEIPSETSHLTDLDQKKQSPKKLKNSKNKDRPKHSDVSDNTAKLESEASPRPSVTFRCPLLELDSNVPRIFEFPQQKNEVKILENIILKPIDFNPVAVNGEKSPTLMLESKNLQEDDELEKIRLASLHVEGEETLPEETTGEASLPKDATEIETTLPEDTIEAETCLPEDSIAAESAFEGNSTEADSAFPGNLTEAEATLPGESSEVDATQPEESTEAESILPDDTTEPDGTLPADTMKDGNTLEDVAETSETKNEVQSDDIKHSPVRICAESLISDSDDDVMVVDDSNMDVSDLDSDVESVQVPKDRDTLDIIIDLLQSAHPLNTLPTRGDTVLFKLQKIKGNERSGTTEFIAGNCAYVNRRTKVITVETITCPSGIGRVLSQYCVKGLDESSENVGSLSVHLRDMIEAKIVVATID
ncbi:coilin [Drosophila subpulchrella]|uniref:coilin n=1 Tax=Drosophila subpulchrella TaxID=1486046 RepID=UPI0018A1AC49|nr:coilin [Drosophila subpulchrella]